MEGGKSLCSDIKTKIHTFCPAFIYPLLTVTKGFSFFFSVSCFLCFTLNFLFPNIPLRSSAASLNCCQKLQYSLGVDAVGGAGISVETSSPRLVLISVSPWPVCTKSSHLYTPLNTAPGSDFNICTFVMGLFFFFLEEYVWQFCITLGS